MYIYIHKCIYIYIHTYIHTFIIILTSTDLNLSSRERPPIPAETVFGTIFLPTAPDDKDDETDDDDDDDDDDGFRIVPNDPEILLIASLPLAQTCLHPREGKVCMTKR